MEVGYCGNKRIKCWLDTKSVKDVIDTPDIIKYITEGEIGSLDESVLQEVTDNYLKILKNKEDYLSDEDFNNTIEEIKGLIKDSKFEDAIEKVDDNLEKVFLNSEKVNLLFLRGNAYAKLARNATSTMTREETATEKEEESEEEENGEDAEGEEEEDLEEKTYEIISVNLTQEHSKITLAVTHSCDFVKFNIMSDRFLFFDKKIEEGTIITQIKEFDADDFVIEKKYYAKIYCVKDDKIIGKMEKSDTIIILDWIPEDSLGEEEEIKAD